MGQFRLKGAHFASHPAAALPSAPVSCHHVPSSRLAPTALPADPAACLPAYHLQESGEVDQDAGMLSDDVVEKGYALLCVSLPQSDCHVRVIPEVGGSSALAARRCPHSLLSELALMGCCGCYSA